MTPLADPRSHLRRSAAVVIAGLLLASILTPATSTRAAGPPPLELRVASDSVTLTAYKNQPVHLEPGLYVASPGGDLDLRVARPDYDTPVALTQWVDGVEDRTLDPSLLADRLQGLRDFFHVTITRKSGAPIADYDETFCPSGGEQQRINDQGPVDPRYPNAGCWAMPFTKGIVWGIDHGWAVENTSFGHQTALTKGRYVVDYEVNEPYRTLFAFPDHADSARISVRVEVSDCYDYGYGCGHRHERAGAPERPGPAVPDDPAPDPSTLPDLVPLPAFNVHLQSPRKQKEYLTFGANVWNAGAAPLVVEGYRDPDEDVMAGFQYFYDGGAPVGRWEVGEFEFDHRDGHSHWHFTQFARYALLDASQQVAVRSHKEAFCLAPTDAIDLTQPGAEWRPSSVGLGASCGRTNSLWLRQILESGWGDTYGQWLPGQAFNVRKLPNGTYYVAVTANPDDALIESDDTNNTELRKIFLRGRPGHRTVVVPPWHGIDSEGDPSTWFD